MVSGISRVLTRFVGTGRLKNPMRKNLKFKFNAKLQESHINLSNFIQDKNYSNKGL